MTTSNTQLAKIIARREAIKKSVATKSAAPAPVAEVVEHKPRQPVAVTMTIESVEERTGPKAGEFGYCKVAYVSKSGKAKSGATAMVFGEAYAALKAVLVAGSTIKALTHFRAKKDVGYSLTLVGLAA